MNNTLITVLGTSPQVMLETLFALKGENFPQRVIIFTTKHGAQRIKDLEVTEKIKALCSDYNLPIPTLAEADIFIVKDSAGQELEDIRNHSDQEAMADQITHTVRDLVKDNDTAIHASIAGGRKSMSFYMGYIFSIFARPCDKLSHVLVAPEFESNNFWYPTPTPSRFLASTHYQTGEKVYLDAQDAIIELAEIPFLRINKALSAQGDLLTQNASYRETLEAYQLALNPEQITLIFTKDHHVLLNGKLLKLPIETLAFYRVIAESPSFKSNAASDLEAALLEELAKISGFDLAGEMAFDKLDEIADVLQDDKKYKINAKFYSTVNEKGLTNSIINRMKGEITEALKKVAIGEVVRRCEVTSVKSELNTDNIYPRTKSGYLGLQLPPSCISFL